MPSSERGAGDAAPPGVRVVLDARPLQEPERNPTTALYLERLLRAFADQPLAGESFVLILGSPGDDPGSAIAGLAVAGRRRLPPTRRIRVASLLLDPFLLRGAAIGTAFGAGRRGAAGIVYHAAGGALPLASGLPIVATLLDLATWELPARYQREPLERFGQRLRARLLRGARRLIVASEATGSAANRFLHVPRQRIRVVPLAATRAPAVGADDPRRVAEVRGRLGLPERYLVMAGRYDARKDMRSLLRALALLRTAPSPAPGAPWPPVVALAGVAEGDARPLSRLVAREDAGALVHLVPRLESVELDALTVGARGFVYPALSEGSGLPVLDALALGMPVVATTAGVLPEVVADAGILVAPRDPERLAAALATIWADDRIHGRLAGFAAQRASGSQRTWAEVARETRDVYAEAAGER